MKGLTVVLLVLLLAAMAAGSAQAGKPQKGSEDLEDNFLVVNCADYGHDFEVWDYSQSHGRWTNHFDKSGNWLRQEYHVNGVDHLYNSSSPEHSVEGSFHLAAHIKPGPQPNYYHVTRTGVDWNIQLPGYGAVYHQSGLNELMFEEVGPDEFEFRAQLKRVGLDRQDFKALCEALK